MITLAIAQMNSLFAREVRFVYDRLIIMHYLVHGSFSFQHDDSSTSTSTRTATSGFRILAAYVIPFLRTALLRLLTCLQREVLRVVYMYMTYIIYVNIQEVISMLYAMS